MRARLAASKHNEAIALSELVQECRMLATVALMVSRQLPEDLQRYLTNQAQAVDVAFAKYAAVSAERNESQKPARRKAG